MHFIQQYWRDSSIAHKLVVAGLFVFVAFVTIDWDVAKNGLYLACLIAIVSLAVNRRYSVKLDKTEWVLIAIIVLLIAHALLSLWMNNFPEYGYEHVRSRMGKLLFFIPIYLFIRKNGFPYWLLLAIVSAGAIVGGVDALIGFIGNNYAFWKRVNGGGDPVFYYTVIMGSYLVVLWSAIPRSFRFSLFAGFGISIASAFALFSVVISGTRGVWLGVVAALIVLFVAKRNDLKLKGSLVLVGFVVILVASLWQVNYLRTRVSAAYQQTKEYFLDGPRETSVGERFELWKIAAELGIEHPFFGVGPAGYADTIKEEYQERGWNRNYYIYEYPHNQFMGAFACLGIPGLILDLLILVVPAWLFLEGWHRLDSNHRNQALSGGLVVVVYFASCLSYDHLMGRVQVSVYAVLIGLLLGIVKYNLMRQSQESG